MKIALFANIKKDQAISVLRHVSSFLRSKDVDVVIEQNDSPHLPTDPAFFNQLPFLDLIISIGGDGSILHVIHHTGITNCPIIGINLGTLGFLADISLQDLDRCLDLLIQKKYAVSQRTVLRGTSSSSIHDFAINEIAIHRGAVPHLVDIAVFLDDLFVNTFSADGVIIATPGGSTAYSLSAGGPIISPDVPALVITPICPHTISNRPIVLMPQNNLRIELLNKDIEVDVTFDGQKPSLLTAKTPLNIHIDEKKFQLASLEETNFFHTLRSKLGLSGSLRISSKL